MSGFPWGRFSLTLLAAGGLGVAVMKAVTPTPEQTYQALAPDLRRKVDEARRLRLEQEAALREQMLAHKEGRDADKPVWAASTPGTSR